MLNRVEAYTPAGTMLTLPVADAPNSFEVRDISGLGPVAAAVTSTQYAVVDGEVQDGSVVGKRNIVMQIKPQPNWGAGESVKSLRRQLYRFFMPKSKTRLRFYDDEMETVEISGTVESCEPAIFSKDGLVQVSILCMDPHFTAAAPSTFSGLTQIPYAGGFYTIPYLGDVETGYVVEISQAAVGQSSSGLITVQSETEILSFEGVLNDSQNVRVSSKDRDKYLREIIKVSQSQINILGSLVPLSTWPTLKPDVTNRMKVGTFNPLQNFLVTYYNRYGGI